MPAHEKYRFKSLDEFSTKIKELGIDIAVTEDTSPLARKVRIGNKEALNAIAVLPMEGCDSTTDGSPTELVERRYLRFAAGGAGLLWWEACAVVPEGRSNPFQMMLTKENIGKYAMLLEKANQSAANSNGSEFTPIHVLQLTHSGRYSRPNTHKFEPIVAQHDPKLDEKVGIDEQSPIVSDAYLESLVEHFVSCSKLAREAGFDGVDIKACHSYLLSELSSSYNRAGKYGGSFENRTRLLRDIVSEIKRALDDDFIIACRFNAFDAHPYPYGFGVGKDDFMRYDTTEPLKLVRMLCDNGAALLGSSAGNPYYTYPHVLRPFDSPAIGAPVPQEHPLESAARLFALTKEMQKEAGNVPVVGSGYTWLRQFMPNVGAANLAAGQCGFVGLGRSSFAYPNAPKEILAGKFEPKKCCTTCSKCTQIMRDHGKSGCVVRDSEVYVPLYKVSRADAISRGK